MMNPEIKARWLEKLRSGDYKQGTGYLKLVVGDEFHYCCLGVLCEIAVADGILSPSVEGTSDASVQRYYAASDDGDFNETVLPRAVAAWAGINSEGIQENWTEGQPCPDAEEHGLDDDLCGFCHRMELTTLNDDRNSTFDKIADVIEKWF